MEEMANVPKLHIDDEWNFQTWSIVNKRLEEQISVYKSEIKNYRERIGFDLDRMREDRVHHRWLALYQCRGMAPEKIRDWEQKHHRRTVDPTTISHIAERPVGRFPSGMIPLFSIRCRTRKSSSKEGAMWLSRLRP
jgi:hypothetical protein